MSWIAGLTRSRKVTLMPSDGISCSQIHFPHFWTNCCPIAGQTRRKSSMEILISKCGLAARAHSPRAVQSYSHQIQRVRRVKGLSGWPRASRAGLFTCLFATFHGARVSHRSREFTTYRPKNQQTRFIALRGSRVILLSACRVHLLFHWIVI